MEELKKDELEKLSLKIQKIEGLLDQIKKILYKDSIGQSYNIDTKSAREFVEGYFNGRSMIGDNGKVYDVPENYASKSKLVEGDRMKLVIAADGTFVYKQILPIERERLTGNLVRVEDIYKVKVENKEYNVLRASITYFKVKEGDKITVLVPKKEDAKWVAIENKVD